MEIYIYIYVEDDLVLRVKNGNFSRRPSVTGCVRNVFGVGRKLGKRKTDPQEKGNKCVSYRESGDLVGSAKEVRS